ncbi:WbqC family protein [Agrilutibacter solisilvae]|uniref:WbqC family protein n=1 Tax=Agrilutibacter solisilvae TaxID=2763317 RepID=A0A974XX55_9GAMM|nr:WbqC family protein [Lysobacter solisilvae]QSX77451.1 WbqC family protein [Lysobacter solisilvae]
MQPYFFPYPGYFRLFAAADCFVMLDCVQFNRRGRVHRAQLPGPAGGAEWLTLPLARQPRDVLIRDLAFAEGARNTLDARLRRFPWLAGSDTEVAGQLHRLLGAPLSGVVDFLEHGLRLVGSLLDLRPTLLRSSTLGVDPALRGQERIIAIVRALGGVEYINPPGGRHLYHGPCFADAGLRLSFLSPYAGPHPYLLPALLGAGPAAVRADVLATSGTSQ